MCNPCIFIDKKSLHLCLSVNRTWCEIIVPILWKDPWKYLKREKEKLLLRIIISHLPDKSRNKVCQDILLFTNSYVKYDERPLFNYISFCRHLDFYKLKNVIIMNNIISVVEFCDGKFFCDT